MGLRDLMFRGWYWYVNKADKNAEVLFMNYGYHDDNEKVEMNENDEPNRYSAQLYHRLARTVDLNQKDIVEIGCGRGGGLSYIANRFNPKSAIGIDLDARAAKFGNEYYKSDILKFEQGDAQDVNLKDESKDVVFNVESSHRYPHEMEEYHEQVKKFDFKLFDEQIINPNVISALEHDTPRREGLVKKLTPKMLHKTALNFAGVKGSETFNQIKNGDYTYFVYCYQKN